MFCTIIKGKNTNYERKTMNENIFKNLEEEHDKSRRESRKRGIFIFILIVIFVVLAFLLIQSSMSREDVQKALKIVSTKTRWVDKKITPFEVSIVPAIWIKLENVSDRDIQYLQLNGRFEFIDSGKVHSSGDAVVFQAPLGPGQTSEEILLRANYGYKASSREAFIENKDEWKDMQVKIFARTQGSSFAQIGEVYPIDKVITGEEGGTEIQDEASIRKRNELTTLIGESIEVISTDSIWITKLETEDTAIIVPQMMFQVKNIGGKSFDGLIFKGVFIIQDEEKLLGEGYNTEITREFSPDEISSILILKSDLGYSASSKKEFFLNSYAWKDVRVRLYVKSMDTDFALLGNYPVKKKIKGVRVVTDTPEQ